MAPETELQPARDEFEVAYYTKELGRPLQRKLLQQRLNDLSRGSAGVAADHPDDRPAMQEGNPKQREDRAG